MYAGRRTRRWSGPVAGLLCLVVVTSACTSAAAQRIKDASRVIAVRIGTSSDDVERTFKTRFSTLTEAQLADEAEQTVQRTTWLDNAIARVAAERVRTAKAVQRSTCKLIDAYDFLVDLSEAEQETEIRTIITDELRTQGLSEDEKNVKAVAEAIIAQVDSLQARGSLDLESMSSDLFCFLEV
jgi:hypothetical protein